MTSLLAYIVRRLILLLFVVLGVSALIFAITMLFPAPIRALLYVRSPQQTRPEVINAVIEQYGLNDPFYYQYGRWLSQVVQGNLGWSQTSSETVTEAISKRWPYTFEIVMFAAPLIVFFGIYLGVQSAIHRNGPIDHGARILSIIGWSLPSFWLGLILIIVFSGVLGWFHTGALSQEFINIIHTGGIARYTGVDFIDSLLNGQWRMTVDIITHVIMPVMVIVTIDIALLIRVMRSSMLESLGKPYIVTAKAKGLAKKVVIYKHARRNALIPVATLSGMLVAGLLGGLVITETVFGFGGIGQWAARAALSVDIPAVLGYAMFSAVIFVIANLIVDVLYAYIDPRIRLE